MTERGEQIPYRRILQHVSPITLHNIKDVLKRGLSESFTKVRVCVVKCPDLTKHPFYFTHKGLCGNPKALEIGETCNGLITESKNRTRDFISMLHDFSCGPGFIIGGSLQHMNSINKEYITNVAYWGQTGNLSCTIGNVWNNTMQHGVRLECNIPSNFFMSNGVISGVLKVRVEQRKANINFADAMHNALRMGYGRRRLVVLGGAFYVNNGAVKHEVTLRKLAPINSIFYPYKSPFHEVETPLIGAGTVYSFTSYGPYRFRGQRFYTVSTDGREGGLYCNDCSPNTTEYIGYFNVAGMLNCRDIEYIR